MPTGGLRMYIEYASSKLANAIMASCFRLLFEALDRAKLGRSAVAFGECCAEDEQGGGGFSRGY